MSPEEHAAMTAVRARFVAAGEHFRVPSVGTQASMDGQGDVPSYRDVPKRWLPDPEPLTEPTKPEPLTLW